MRLVRVWPDQTLLVQEAESSWKFDALELQEASGNMPLSSLGFYLIQVSPFLIIMLVLRCRVFACGKTEA